MKKILNLETILTGFDGKFIEGEDKQPLTLRKVLLNYINLSHLMNLGGNEEFSLYFIGRQIGEAKELVELGIQDFQLIKKIADNGKITQINQAAQPMPVYGMVITQQVRVLLEQAITIEEKKPKTEETPAPEESK